MNETEKKEKKKRMRRETFFPASSVGEESCQIWNSAPADITAHRRPPENTASSFRTEDSVNLFLKGTETIQP